MTKLAQLLLLLTSLSPIGLVYAAVLSEAGEYALSLWIAGVSVFLVALCRLLLHGGVKWLTAVPRRISDPTTKEAESLSFFIAYALPLVAETPSSVVPLGVVAFAVVVSLTVWQQQIFHVNPLMGLLGYHFFSAKNDIGAQVLVVTRNKLLCSGDLRVVRLSEYLWLDATTEGNPGHDDVGAGQGAAGL